MKTIACIHPNCKVLAERPHPRQEDGENVVCNQHYTEIKESLKNQIRFDYQQSNHMVINWNK